MGVIFVKGIKEWDNKNGFHIVQLHYTADPGKDPETSEGKLWFDRVRPAYTEDGWNREMEINFSAFAGKPVYSEFQVEQIVDLSWSSEDKLTLYRGWDFGYHHPAVHFSTVNALDQWLWLHEEMGSDIHLDKFADHILDVTTALFGDHVRVRDFVPHDAVNVKDVVTEREEATCLAVLENRGICGEVTRSDLIPRIDIIRQKLKLRQDGRFGILVNSSMTVCKEAMMGGYHRSDKPGREDIPVKDGYYEHLMDAAGMTAVNLFQPGDLKREKRDNVKVLEELYEFDQVTGCVVG